MNSLESIRKSYDEWHSQLEVDVNADAPWHRMIRSDRNFSSQLSGKKVLEIGCGRGGFACWLSENYPDIKCFVAADFSSEAVSQGKSEAGRRGLSLIDWEVQDVQAIGHDNGSFDTVISCETIEHVQNPAKAVKELARVLRSGGYLYLSTPNYRSFPGAYRIATTLFGRKFSEEGQVINQFTTLPKTFRWVRKSGLQIVGYNTMTHILPCPGVGGGIKLRFLDKTYPPFNWFGMNSLVVARKL